MSRAMKRPQAESSPSNRVRLHKAGVGKTELSKRMFHQQPLLEWLFVMVGMPLNMN